MHMLLENKSALAYIFITIFLWGMWGFFGKLALEKGMKPISVFFFEAIFGLILGVTVSLIYLKIGEGVEVFSNWNLYGVLSGFALALGLFTYYLALGQESIHLVVPLTAIYPLIAVMLGIIFLGEVITIKEIIAISMLIIGTLLLLF